MLNGNARDGFQAVVHDGDRVTAHEIAAPNPDDAERQAVVLHDKAVADGLAPASLGERLASLEAWVAAVAPQFGMVWLPQHLDRIDGMVRPVVVPPEERGRRAKAEGLPRAAPNNMGGPDLVAWLAGYDAPVLMPLDLGRKARVDGKDGTPPAGLSEADTAAWREGWDEADHDARSPLMAPTGPVPVHAIGDDDQTRIAGRFAAGHTPEHAPA